MIRTPGHYLELVTVIYFFKVIISTNSIAALTNKQLQLDNSYQQCILTVRSVLLSAVDEQYM